LIAARNLPAEDLAAFLGAVEEVRCTALARLTSPSLSAAPDTLLNVDDAAVRMGMSPGYLYRHHADFPFSRRIGRRLLFSSRGIDEYLRRRH
jgi:predicted DNA-binding transcriptional regulator AlpA